MSELLSVETLFFISWTTAAFGAKAWGHIDYSDRDLHGWLCAVHYMRSPGTSDKVSVDRLVINFCFFLDKYCSTNNLTVELVIQEVINFFFVLTRHGGTTSPDSDTLY